MPPRKAIWHSVNSKGPGRRKSFTHIEHHTGAVGREGLVHYIPILTPELYLLPSQGIPVLTPTSATARIGVHTATK